MVTANNLMIEALPRQDRAELLRTCERVDLGLADVVQGFGRPIKFVYFPTDAIVVLTAPTDQRDGVGVAMVGRESMTGSESALIASSSAVEAVVQRPGLALRAETALFLETMHGSTALREAVNLCNAALIVETTRAASCICFHQLTPRLARWLLMSADRVAEPAGIRVTQEFLARVLAVRRVSVTAAAQALKHQGLIDYERGEVLVLDRPGLEAAACSCYSHPR